MTRTATKPVPARLVGGPQHGVVGEIEGTPPLTLAFGEGGGFIYTLMPDPNGLSNPAVLTYGYNAVLSPAHDLIVQADLDALREVAAQEGVSVEALLLRAQEKRAAAKGKPHPLDLLTAEADRLGTTVGALLNRGVDVQEIVEGAGQ